MLDKLIEKSIDKKGLTQKELDFLINFPDLTQLNEAAENIKSHFFNNQIQLCSIINAKSGGCSEDCKFCAQSSHYKTGAPMYDFVDLKTIEKRALEYKNLCVKRFSIVMSGKNIAEKDLDKLIKAVRIVKEAGLLVDVSAGILDKVALEKLKDAGLDGLHHNLETSRRYFKNVCTTHKYDDDIRSIKEAKKFGLFICVGGVFGIGENWQDRCELALTLKDLDVDSIPLNFLVPIKGTPYENRKLLDEDEALRIIAIYRFLLPDKYIRVCGGRNAVFDKNSKVKVLKSGANGLMVGNYLTISGFDVASDLNDIKMEGLKAEL